MRSTALVTLILILSGFTTVAQAQQKNAVQAAPVNPYGTSEFRLGPDDIIEVYIYQEKDFPVTVQVRPDGKVSLPLIGEMPASGKTAAEMQKEIAEKYKVFFSEPAVTVVVKEVNSPKVSVQGEVKNSGVFKIKDRATVLDAIALAGGLTVYAKKDKILVIRVDSAGNQRHMKINLEDQIKGRTDPFYVLPYDKIYVQ